MTRKKEPPRKNPQTASRQEEVLEQNQTSEKEPLDRRGVKNKKREDKGGGLGEINLEFETFINKAGAEKNELHGTLLQLKNDSQKRGKQFPMNKSGMGGGAFNSPG